MTGTVGVAVAVGAETLPWAALLVGDELAGPPTFPRLLFGWRFDLVFGTAAIVLAVLYLLGVRRVPGWPRGRTVAWLLGCLAVLVATSSGVGRYAPAVLSAQVASHTLLAVLAPVLLAVGGPVTLGLRALSPAGRRAWLVALVRSRACRTLTHPFVSFVLLVGPFYLLYVAGALDAVLGGRWGHLAVNAVVLAGGYAFFWPVFGVDPGVRRLPHVGRAGLMAALLVAFGFLAVVVGNARTLVGADFYRSLGLVGDLAADQSLAGSVLWALAELPVLVLVMVAAVQWARSDEREAIRAETTAEPDLAAYNAMLAALDERDRR